MQAAISRIARGYRDGIRRSSNKKRFPEPTSYTSGFYFNTLIERATFQLTGSPRPRRGAAVGARVYGGHYKTSSFEHAPMMVRACRPRACAYIRVHTYGCAYVRARARTERLEKNFARNKTAVRAAPRVRTVRARERGKTALHRVSRHTRRVYPANNNYL